MFKVLDAFVTDVPQPTDWASFRSPFLEALGEKSYAAFAKNALLCSIAADERGVRFSPMKNIGSNGGFDCFSDERKVEVPPNASLEEVGQAVLLALDMCE